MNNTYEGHRRVEFLIKLIQISFWVAVAITATSFLAVYIRVAVSYENVPNTDGILAGYFFLFVLIVLVLCFFYYVVKNILQVKIDYYDDVKYIRDSMESEWEDDDSDEDIQDAETEDGLAQNANTSNPKANIIENKLYYIMSKKGLYLSNVFAETNGIITYGYSKDKNYAKSFSTRGALLTYVSEYDIDIVNEFDVVQE